VSEKSGLWDLTLIECDGIDKEAMEKLAIAAGEKNGVHFSVSESNWIQLDFVENLSVQNCLGDKNICAIIPSTQSGKKQQPMCASISKVCSQPKYNLDNCKSFPKTCQPNDTVNQCQPIHKDCSFLSFTDNDTDQCANAGCASEKAGSKFVCESDAKCEATPEKGQCMLGVEGNFNGNFSGKDALKNFPCKLVSDGKAYCKPKDQQRID
jgi:hypothetical protein